MFSVDEKIYGRYLFVLNFKFFCVVNVIVAFSLYEFVFRLFYTRSCFTFDVLRLLSLVSCDFMYFSIRYKCVSF